LNAPASQTHFERDKYGSTKPALKVQGIVRRFGGLVAVNKISFQVHAGEILGLIGPNGSGKSTVMKLIMGILVPNEGVIEVNDQPIQGLAAHLVAKAGVGIVFQHSRPLQRQTVLEHIKLALLPDEIFLKVNHKQLDERALEIAKKVGLSHLLDRLPGTLSFADLRRIELAKAIARNPKVVLIDEPFAGLTAGEVQEFSELIKTFKDEGRAVLLVDHNVKSVAALVDRVFAMYLGSKIAEGRAVDVMQDSVVREVYLGGALQVAERPTLQTVGPALLALENVSVFYGKAQALDNINLHIREREFVSIVGLNGAGKSTLFNAVSGILEFAGGIKFGGQDLRGKTAAQIARSGLIQCPETRELFGELSVGENLEVAGLHLLAQERKEQREWLFELFPILKSRIGQAAATLSGGEQQMLAIARCLMSKPKLLLLDEPTLGLAPVILEQLSKALETLRQTTDLTVLLSEQNVTFALPHADRVYVLEHARIIWEGKPERFVDEMGQIYL
jgi:ABC-type branched-subunit amino acid transport system ATPase component